MSAFGPTPQYCYVDYDIDGARASHALCAAFVDACDLKYGLSSKVVAELGGGEVARLPGFFDTDYEWSARGACRPVPQRCCRVVFELYVEDCPLACENFAALCAGDRGVAKGSGIPLQYAGSAVHRVETGFVAQAGDFVKGNGSGGESVFGKKFKDELKGLRRKHDVRGCVVRPRCANRAVARGFTASFLWHGCSLPAR